MFYFASRHMNRCGYYDYCVVIILKRIIFKLLLGEATIYGEEIQVIADILWKLLKMI